MTNILSRPKSAVFSAAASGMVIILLLLTLLPVFHRMYSAANLQPLLLDLASQKPQEPVKIIVQKIASGNNLEEAVVGLGGKVTGDLSFINSFVASLPAGQLPALAAEPGIRWISLDSPVEKAECKDCMPVDDASNYTSVINADKVWNTGTGEHQEAWLQGEGIGVAVLDSGINGGLIDFATRGDDRLDKSRVVSSVKIESKSPTLNDVYGHGTLVAGVIGSNGLGSSGMHPGVAPMSNLINVKINHDDGSSTASDVLAGLQWVAKNADRYHIRVVNLSLNSSVSQSYNVDPLDAGVEALWLSGITVVVSAGNNGSDALFAPANDPFVITVGAITNKTNSQNQKWKSAPFSAFGKDESGNSKPDLVAPGTGIISDVASLDSVLATNYKAKLFEPGKDKSKESDKSDKSDKEQKSQYKTSFMKVAGTSFSAPQVSGAVALLLQSEPKLTPDQVKYRLKATALSDQSRGDWDNRSTWSQYNPERNGAGILDVEAAVTQKQLNGKVNTKIVPSAMLMSVLIEFKQSPVPGSKVNYSNTNWSSVNWSSVNWSSVNWSSVNWSSVNWSSVNWSSVNWSSVNWSSVNWSQTVWNDD